MSDAESIAKILVNSFGFRRASFGWVVLELRDTNEIERQIAGALRASEAHALARAAGLCAARAQRWHQDSSAHRELLAAADAIRGLTRAREENNNV